MATITITVTVSNPGSGNKYYLDGVLQATYVATPGNTYKFDQSDNSNDGHPLRLSITSDGTHNSGSAYTTGVTTSGTPGNAGAYTQIEVTALTVQALYYYCTAHSGMGGSFNTGSSETVQYQQRAGFAVQNRTTDPVPYAQALADNPYVGSWSSVANMNTATDNLASLGTTNAALGAGGNNPPISDKSETWNGTAWTEGNNLNTARSHMHGAGITTSGVIAGGEAPSNTNAVEKYNGTSWTTSTNYPASKASIGGLGASNTASVFFGGSPTIAETYEFDGTNWTETNDMNTGRNDMAAAGTQTAGIAIGGNIPPRTGITETYNGSTWTEVGDMNTAKNGLGASTQGSTTSALAFGGSVPPGTALTESWDGTSWTEVADLATARYDIGGSGTGNTSALAFAGGTPPRTTATEEFAFTGLPPATPAANYSESIVGDIYYNSGTGQFKAIKDGGAPIGTWASGGNLNTGRGSNKGFGTQNAAITAGGAYGPPGPSTSPLTESYNGTSWAEVSDLNTGRQAFGSLGTSTAGFAVAGYGAPASNITNVESWNGTGWTETTDVNTARTSLRGCGTTTAALAIGGYNPPPALQLDITESWNGSAWTEVGDMNTRRSGAGNALSSPYGDTIIFGGYSQPPPNTANAETWNGSAWTEVANLNSAKDNMGGSGDSSTSALCFGGRTIANTESWNGSSWTEVADLALARGYLASAGSATLALASGGEAPGSPYYRANTEEWTAADFEIKTVTTS